MRAREAATIDAGLSRMFTPPARPCRSRRVQRLRCLMDGDQGRTAGGVHRHGRPSKPSVNDTRPATALSALPVMK